MNKNRSLVVIKEKKKGILKRFRTEILIEIQINIVQRHRIHAHASGGGQGPLVRRSAIAWGKCEYKEVRVGEGAA